MLPEYSKKVPQKLSAVHPDWAPASRESEGNLVKIADLC
jgi:hypothetical protein